MFLIFFLLGLLVGSFLNVVVYRLKVAKNFVLGSSFCPKCKSKIRWYDNIPLLSFVLLNFRCRDCGEKISWQYPIVEFFSGVIFVLVGYEFFVLDNFFSWFETAYYLLIACLLLVIFVYDLLYMEIPIVLAWIGAFLALSFNIFSDFSNGGLEFVLQNFLETSLFLGLLGAFLAWIFFFTLSYGSKGKWMGMGDAYLAIFLGMVLGVMGVFYALVLGFLLGALLGVVLILQKKKNMKSQLPLAPFLIFGTFIMIFWGEKVINWHLSLFY